MYSDLFESALRILGSNSSLKYFSRMWRQDQQGLLTKPFGKSTFTRSSRGRVIFKSHRITWRKNSFVIVEYNIFFIKGHFLYKDWKLFLTETYNRNCAYNSDKRKFCIFFSFFTPTTFSESFLTAVFFETGAMLTPTKSRNGTNCGSGGSFQSYLTHS